MKLIAPSFNVLKYQDCNNAGLEKKKKSRNKKMISMFKNLLSDNIARVSTRRMLSWQFTWITARARAEGVTGLPGADSAMDLPIRGLLEATS